MRYADSFLNALTYPHQMTVRAELYYEGSLVAEVPIISGSVQGDRNSVVRRQLDAEVDPRLIPRDLASRLTPYGSTIRVWRGIRFPNGVVEDVAVFYGRVNALEFGRLQNRLRASDLASFISDARFEAPYTATKGMTVVNQMKALITDVLPNATFTITTTANQTITTPATWDRERGEALDHLAATINCEWWAGPDGSFHIEPLPVLSEADPSWTLDGGETGVTISAVTQLDRAGVYNAVVVNGEPPDGTVPVRSVVRDVNPNSVTRWGGPFGKVPRFFASQFIYTQAQADKVAADMLADAIAGTQSVNISATPNPRLDVGAVVDVVNSGMSGWDGFYFVKSFTLPLVADQAMSLVANVSLMETPVAGHFERRSRGN